MHSWSTHLISFTILGFLILTGCATSQTHHQLDVTERIKHLENDQEIVQELEPLLPEHPNNAELHFQLGSALFFTGDHSNRPLDLLKQAIELDNFVAEYHTVYAIVALTALKDLETAKKHLETALEIDPEDSYALAYYARILYKENDDKKQYVERLEETLSLDNENDFAHFHYAQLMLDGFYNNQSAKTHFEEALRIKPFNPKYHLYYAYLQDEYLVSSKYAKKHYKLALRYDPEYADAHNYYALFLWENEDNSKDALRHFKLAIKYNPEHAAAHLNLGLLFEYLKKYSDALWYVNKAYEMNPDDPIFQKAYLRIKERAGTSEL